jgi:hypothetical protein
VLQAERAASRRRAKSIGPFAFALAVALVASRPAFAPSPASELHHAVAPCDALAPAEIALDCPPAPIRWIDMSFLVLGPFVPEVGEAPLVTPPLSMDHLLVAELAPVPEPAAGLALALGLCGLATLRRVAYFG